MSEPPLSSALGARGEPTVAHRHGHDHANPDTRSAPPRTQRLVAGALIPVGLATVLGLVLLWPDTDRGPRTGLGLDQELARGTVVRVLDEPCPVDDAGPSGAVCRTAMVSVTEGPGNGHDIEVATPEGTGAPALRPGDDVVMTYAPGAPEGLRYQITDFQRGRPLLLLAALFAVVVVAFGRWRGLAALAGLGVSFGVLLLFVLPAILAGSSPLLVAVTGAGRRSHCCCCSARAGVASPTCSPTSSSPKRLYAAWWAASALSPPYRSPPGWPFCCCPLLGAVVAVASSRDHEGSSVS